MLIGSILRHKHTYLLQRHGGTLIAGSSTEYVGFDRAIDESIVSDIHSRASKLLPELAALTPAERWNGFRPGTESGTRSSAGSKARRSGRLSAITGTEFCWPPRPPGSSPNPSAESLGMLKERIFEG